jgi:aspartyl-tRNA(Asn)/glutamyl-tRNA(Gln) amidotransferase subunit B
MSNANIKTQKVIKPESSYEMIIGLEVHAQIISNSKLFSNAPVSFDGEPNKYVSPIDMAMPGMLPTLNQKCIEQAIKTGLALNCKINEYSVFDRKNYFYPDLPQGYQISQFSHPIVGNGYIELENKRNIRIARIHIEQDAGKSIHDQNPRYSYIDLNRAGIGLMEIVTEPDFKSVNEVTEFMKNLRLILRYLGTCDGDMDKGSLRCDVNISVRQAG